MRVSKSKADHPARGRLKRHHREGGCGVIEWARERACHCECGERFGGELSCEVAVGFPDEGRGLAMGAVISECGTYRYWLDRGPEDAPYVAWVLANPSTADAELDDPTVRKARGFTERWGYKRFVFVNCFAGRSTDPKGLLKLRDPVGPENLDYIMRAVETASLVVVAWGNAIVKPLRRHIPLVRSVIHDDARCLGYTADRSPRHPLMLAYSTPLEIYAPRREATGTSPHSADASHTPADVETSGISRSPTTTNTPTQAPLKRTR